VGDDFNLDAFFHGDGSVDLDHPVDDLPTDVPARVIENERSMAYLRWC